MTTTLRNSRALPRSASGPAEKSFQDLEQIRYEIEAHPFVPLPLLVGGHAQTLVSYFWRRGFPMHDFAGDEKRVFEVEPGIRVLCKCRWQKSKTESPTLLVIHGLEGSAESRYMLGVGMKAFAAGFNVLRMNMRNCGATEHLAPTLYNSGMSGDARAVINELAMVDGFKEIYVAGFSMSGNIVLKYAGEEGSQMPTAVKGVCAVSPSIDLAECAAAINLRSNWLYRRSFVSSLKKRIQRKEAMYPGRYDLSKLRRIRTIRDFDDAYTAVDGGFTDADDYYGKSSAFGLIARIRRPTLLIHAQDDPFVPFKPIELSDAKSNPYVILLTPESGGHVGFVSAADKSEDRFWAENQIVRFVTLLSRQFRS